MWAAIRIPNGVSWRGPGGLAQMDSVPVRLESCACDAWGAVIFIASDRERGPGHTFPPYSCHYTEKGRVWEGGQ